MFHKDIYRKDKIWNVSFHEKSTNQKIDDRNWAIDIVYTRQGRSWTSRRTGARSWRAGVEGGFLGTQPSTILQNVPHLLGFKLLKGFKSVFFMKYEVFQTFEVV